MLDRVWRDFDMRLLSVGATYTLWGSLTTVDDLVMRYCEAKNLKSILDRRKRLTEQQQEQLEEIQSRAAGAILFRNWAREDDGRPILRDMLVAYCVAFESAIKAVALAFSLAKQTQDWRLPFFLPPRAIKGAAKKVYEDWDKVGGRGDLNSRVVSFYRESILVQNPDKKTWPFAAPESDENSEWHLSKRQQWLDIETAFRLRNDIVHSSGVRGHERLDVHNESFHPREELALTTVTIRSVERAFRGVLDPLNPEGIHCL